MLEAYTGLLGCGKTYAMVQDAIEYKKKHPHIPVITNQLAQSFADDSFNNFDEMMAILDRYRKEFYVKGKPFQALVLLDEIHLWFLARDYKEFPKQAVSWFTQGRKLGLNVFWTSQAWTQVDVIVRNITQWRWQCFRFGPWFYRWSYDAPNNKRMTFKFYHAKPEVYNSYDTMEIVGDNKGQGRSIGGLASNWEDKKERERVKRSVVRLEDDTVDEKNGMFGTGAVRYRKATMQDVSIFNRDLIELAPGKRLWQDREGPVVLTKEGSK